MYSDHYRAVHEYIEDVITRLEQPSGQIIKYPWLSITLGQFYGGAFWGWDNHHMAMRLAYAGKPEHLRFFVDNLLSFQTSDGFTPNVLLPDSGPAQYFPRFHAQPLLIQAALMYVSQTDDTAWARECFPKLKTYLDYYEKNYSAPFGLFRWPVSWMSGIDNDVVTTFFQPDTIISADINAWMVLEYLSAEKLAARLGQAEDVCVYKSKSEKLRSAVDEVLWNEKMDSYSAYNLCTMQHQLSYAVENLPDSTVGLYAFQTCSNLMPLYARIPDVGRARRMVERYVLSPSHFRSPFGIRSLSRSSEYYNNAVWGNPPRFGAHQRLTNSNWQGPVWVPLCYFMYHALSYYGFKKEAEELTGNTVSLLAKSLKTIGSFSENFDGDSGEPLYARQYCSWNLLADMMVKENTEIPWIMQPVF
jgi:glycogen debranching enzyme